MAKTVIIGAGVMGSAFSVPLADNGHEVHVVGTHLDAHIIDVLLASELHPGLGVSLPTSVSFHQHDTLKQVVRHADLIVLGVNSAGVDWAAQQLGTTLAVPTPIIMLTKGLAVVDAAVCILPDLLLSAQPNHLRASEVLAVVGPCIASELAVRRQTNVVLAGRSQRTVEAIVQLLRTPYYHVHASGDLEGAETCAALKNLYALVVGTARGILEIDQAPNGASTYNLSSAMFAQALSEIAYLVEFMKGKQESVYGLPGVGDLYVTCQAGRNGRMGRLLGMGLSFEEAKTQHMSGITVEGADLLLSVGRTLEDLMSSGQLDKARLPLLRTAISMVCHNSVVSVAWERLFDTHT